MNENSNKNLIPWAIIVAGFLIAGAIIYVTSDKKIEQKGMLSSQQISEKVINYINENILRGQATAVLGEIVEESGLYKMVIKMGDQEFPVYVSPDGKLLFTEAIDLEEKPLEETPEELKETPQVEPSSLEIFAKCLTQKGLKFYGSKNCSWCQKQKELFGNSFQYINYIECVDSQTGQWSEECKKAEIQVVPTWEFADGKKEVGFKSFEQLSELSNCQL